MALFDVFPAVRFWLHCVEHLPIHLFYCLVGGFTQTNNSQDITPVVVLYKNSVVDNFELRRGVLEKAVCG